MTPTALFQCEVVGDEHNFLQNVSYHFIPTLVVLPVFLPVVLPALLPVVLSVVLPIVLPMVSPLHIFVLPAHLKLSSIGSTWGRILGQRKEHELPAKVVLPTYPRFASSWALHLT
jgi:hypothetical protein